MSAPEEFDAFFEWWYDRLVGTLWLYCGDRVVAEDCAQEALVRVARDWERVRVMASPGGWVHRVGFNLVSSHFRRRRIERRAAARLRVVSPAVDDGQQVVDALVVQRAVASLSPRQRQAVILYYFADLPVTEVAEVMEAPANSVKSWLSRARQQLHVVLAGESDAGPCVEDVGVH